MELILTIFSPDHFTAETRIKGKPYTGNKEEIRQDLNLSKDDFVFYIYRENRWG